VPLGRSPGINRRLLTRTKVRWQPRPRKLTVAAPVAPLAKDEPISPTTCGSWFRMSSMRGVPTCAISAAVTVVTAHASSEGCLMRER